MRHSLFIVLLSGLVSTSPQSGHALAPQSPSSSPSIETRARTFIATYADDLRAHRRDAIAARYALEGAYLLRQGKSVRMPFAEIRAHYLKEWEGPAFFEWGPLAYEALTPDVVTVQGTFRWQSAGDPAPAEYAYSAVFVREQEQLRIRLELEWPLTRGPI